MMIFWIAAVYFGKDTDVAVTKNYYDTQKNIIEIFKDCYLGCC